MIWIFLLLYLPSPVMEKRTSSVLPAVTVSSGSSVVCSLSHGSLVSLTCNQYQVFDGSLLIVISVIVLLLTYASLHLQPDQVVHLNRVLDRKFLGYVVCKSTD